MSMLPTIKVTDGKTVAIINVSDEAAWAQRGFTKPAVEIPSSATDNEQPVGKRKK